MVATEPETSALEAALGHVFRDPLLLRQALAELTGNGSSTGPTSAKLREGEPPEANPSDRNLTTGKEPPA